jgi:hypothetical protein
VPAPRRHLFDLGVEGRHDGDLAGHDRGVGRLHRRRAAQLLSPEDLLDLDGLGFNVAPVRPLQRGSDATSGQPSRAVGIACSGQQLERVRSVEVGERLERCGEELPQRRAQPQHMPAAFPDQALVGARDQLDRLGLLGVAGQRAVVSSVDADDLGQHVRVAGIRLRTRGRMPFPIPGHRHRQIR